MMQEQATVLIVGAGAAGLSLSLLLRQQGLRPLLIERRNDISWYPRARTLNFRTMEVFRGLGISAQVRAAGAPMTRMFRKRNLAADEQEEVLDPATLVEHLEEISPEPFGWYCPQSRLEPLLRERATRQGLKVRYGNELLSLARDEAGVSATVRDRATGTVGEVRADYLVAADGVHSSIREMLGVPTQGLGELPGAQIFIYFRANWGDLVQGYEADAFLINNEGGRGMFVITDRDRGMFVVSYAPTHGEKAQAYSVGRCQELIRVALGKPGMDVEVVDIADWRPVQRVAERFQQGRVFLVGDAAHTMPPYMGLGANTAIQSAQNLAWKLAAVLKGQAAPSLLYTYQTERHPVGLLAAEQSLTGPAMALFEREMRGHTQQQAPRQLPILAPIVGYRYRSAAVCAEDPVAPSAREFELLNPLTLRGLPGSRVPHLWLEQQGRRISTLDLLDGRFVLLSGAGGAAWCAAAPAVAVRLGIDLAAYRLGQGADLQVLETSWEERAEISPEGAVLVRPDGFVAWRSRSAAADPGRVLAQALAHILGGRAAPARHP